MRSYNKCQKGIEYTEYDKIIKDVPFGFDPKITSGLYNKISIKAVMPNIKSANIFRDLNNNIIWWFEISPHRSRSQMFD